MVKDTVHIFVDANVESFTLEIRGTEELDPDRLLEVLQEGLKSVPASITRRTRVATTIVDSQSNPSEDTWVFDVTVPTGTPTVTSSVTYAVSVIQVTLHNKFGAGVSIQGNVSRRH